jgi:hypothetical protein
MDSAAAGAVGPFAFGFGFLVACACALLTSSRRRSTAASLGDCPDTRSYDGGCRRTWDEGDMERSAFVGAVLVGAAGGMAGAGVAGSRFECSFLARVGTLLRASARRSARSSSSSRSSFSASPDPPDQSIVYDHTLPPYAAACTALPVWRRSEM